MTRVEHQAKFLLDLCKLIQWATEQGWIITEGEGSRPIEMQQLYVKQGRSKTMKSNHLVRLAHDLNFFRNGKPVWDRDSLAAVGDYWESLDPLNRWGGRFKSIDDSDHFERNVPGISA